MVGLPTLGATLIEDTAPASEIKEIQLVTALHRAELSPHEVFCEFQEWLAVHQGCAAKELAVTGRSQATLSA
jgi:hypothetical protein